jgi:photosystem II stability/assembly factor-like uncharacterized protein
MAPSTRKPRPRKGRSVQAPKQRQAGSPRPLVWPGAGAAAVVVIAAFVGIAVIRSTSGGGGPTSADGNSSAAGLPNTPDYHSLSVSAASPANILLGTHSGLYRSTDGGRTWAFEALQNRDAMNLARPGGQTLWTAGHDVLAKSADGGETWVDVDPRGLPTLDVHGFAVDPRDSRTLYAAVAGRGLYRSTDNGVSFAGISRDVGGAVMALVVTRSGEILAGDMQKGLLASRDGGATWRRVLDAQLMGLAVNPRDPKRLLAAGPGVILSTNGGRTWRKRLAIAEGAGPVAWSPSNPSIAYAVGFDRTLYRSSDSGQSWRAVG